MILFLLTLFAGIFALSQSPSTSPPADSQPRIAALSPAISVILHDLGLEHLIVSRHSWDLVLDRSIPVGHDDRPDYEALLSVEPTHILLQLEAAQPPPRLLQFANEGRWQLITIPILSLDSIRSATTTLANLFAPGADQPLLNAMDVAWSKRDRIFTGRTLVLAALDPPSALGPGSWHHQLLERLGGAPAIRSGSPYITLDAEDILAMQPEAILLIHPRSPTAAPSPKPSTEDLLQRLGRLATLDVPAIRDRRIALIDNPLAHTPSTAMIGLADEMAVILERWAK